MRIEQEESAERDPFRTSRQLLSGRVPGSRERPARDLRRSMEFLGKLGLEFNSQFTEHKAACTIETR
jgi:hypothetical protein